MRKLIFLGLLPFAVQAAEFVSPLTFDGSNEQKQQVIRYIEKRVEKQMKLFGDSASPTMKSLLEEQSLTSFKKMLDVIDKVLLKEVIKRNCKSAIDLCDYTTIEMLYEQDLESKNKKLKW